MSKTQDPQAVLNYEWDWSLWLHAGETIVSYTLVADPAGVLTITPSDTPTAVTALVGGGIHGTTYEITNHIVTSEGREDDAIISITFREATAAVCEWPVDYAECGPCDALTSLPASGIWRFEDMATEYLHLFTQMQFGLCEVTIRPCRQDCYEGISTYGIQPGVGGSSRWQPALVGGKWYNLGCGGGCRDNCGCGAYGSSMTFDQPVWDILRVEINGVTLDPSAYRVDNRRLLVRQDGQQWPYCQNMSRPLGQEDTWAVTYRVGAPVPIGGQIAAGKLACELAKAACGAGSCELPQRWQTITRQGVTISAALDTFQGLDEGKTGIWLIDAWVASVTRAVTMGVSIAVPGHSGARRTTWGG